MWIWSSTSQSCCWVMSGGGRVAPGMLGGGRIGQCCGYRQRGSVGWAKSDQVANFGRGDSQHAGAGPSP
jgi:hypothetical protein